jgi:hypothetical protein
MLELKFEIERDLFYSPHQGYVARPMVFSRIRRADEDLRQARLCMTSIEETESIDFD